MAEDASNIELVPADQMKEKKKVEDSSDDDDGEEYPDVKVADGQPAEQGSDDGASSDDEGVDKEALNDGREVEEWDEDEAEVGDEDWAAEYDGDYEGEQNEDGERHGEGKCTYIDDAVYEGHWCKGQRDGYGTFRLEDGTRYEGEWSKDKKHGAGKLFLVSGETVEATWENDRIHGKGTISKGDKSKEYIWYYDMKIDQVDQDAYCDRMLLNICCCVFLIIGPIAAIVAKSGALFLICVVAWCCNIVEFLYSKTYGYLKKQVSLSQVQDKIKHLKKKGPKITWHMQNYHYETRYRTVNGKRQRRRVRVNTNYYEKNYKYKKWVDLTPPEESLNYLETFKLCRLDQPLKIEMAAKATKKYNKKKNKFYKKKKVDKHADFWEKRYLPGKDEKCLVRNDKHELPWFTNFMIYVCCSIFFVGWVQRYMFVKSSQRIVFEHHKLLIK